MLGNDGRWLCHRCHVGPHEPPSLVAFAAALICLAGVFFILFQSMTKWAADSHYALAGKGLALLFALVGAGILLLVLYVFLQ